MWRNMGRDKNTGMAANTPPAAGLLVEIEVD